MINEEDNERMLNAIEGKKQFKHCINCGRKFHKGTICPWCKTGWVYAYEDGNHVTYADETRYKYFRNGDNEK